MKNSQSNNFLTDTKHARTRHGVPDPYSNLA